jgi:uncharacterized protein YbjQ (UPF0145 family)
MAAASVPTEGLSVKKIIVLVEALALAGSIVAVATINPQTGQMIVAASEAANDSQESAIGKIIAFAKAAGTVAVLTVNPQSAKRQPH